MSTKGRRPDECRFTKLVAPSASPTAPAAVAAAATTATATKAAQAAQAPVGEGVGTASRNGFDAGPALVSEGVAGPSRGLGDREPREIQGDLRPGPDTGPRPWTWPPRPPGAYQ